METLTIKIKDSKALKLIHDLENLNLIQIVSTDIMPSQNKLSTLLRGCVSPMEADNMHKELEQMRG